MSKAVVSLINCEENWSKISNDALRETDIWSSKNIECKWKSLFDSIHNKTTQPQLLLSDNWKNILLMREFYKSTQELLYRQENSSFSFSSANQIKISRYNSIAKIAHKFLPDGSIRKKIALACLRVAKRKISSLL